LSQVDFTLNFNWALY